MGEGFIFRLFVSREGEIKLKEINESDEQKGFEFERIHRQQKQMQLIEHERPFWTRPPPEAGAAQLAAI